MKRINCIQKFIFTIGFTYIFHGMVINGIVNVNVSTIERRFKLTSTKSGIIASTYDVTSCLLCPIITYFASGCHKPRVVAIGMLIFAVGCILNAIPHFTSDPYRPPDNQSSGLCSAAFNTTEKTQSQNIESPLPFVLFIFGFILLGAGSVPLITLGLAYIDDNTTKAKSASYIGIVGGIASLGAVCGYLIGGYSLSFYVNTDNDSYGLTRKDPTWIGNWWAPFIFCGVTSVCSVLMLIQFPRKMERPQVVSDADEAERVKLNDSTSTSARSTLKIMMKNPTFVLTNIATGLECFLLNGFSVFLPKVLQNQFLVSPTMASLLAGAVSMPGAFIGHTVSGYVIRRFRMNIKVILKTICVVILISGILSLCVMLHCKSHVRIGNSENCQIEQNCRCESDVFRPICGEDGHVYFSPCHAGCSRQSSVTGELLNCSCISINSTSFGGSAKNGRCSDRCDAIVPFLILLFFTIFFSFSILTPAMMVIMRCVPPAQKSFAVGMQWFSIRILGSIPSPLVIGKVFDASCAVWMKNSSDDNGFCWIYDSSKFARSAVILSITVKILSLTCFLFAFRRCSSRLRNLSKTEIQEQRRLQVFDNSGV